MCNKYVCLYVCVCVCVCVNENRERNMQEVVNPSTYLAKSNQMLDFTAYGEITHQNILLLVFPVLHVLVMNFFILAKAVRVWKRKG